MYHLIDRLLSNVEPERRTKTHDMNEIIYKSSTQRTARMNNYRTEQQRS